MLQRYKEKRRQRDLADRTYVALVTQARTPAFYADLLVPDSLDGRFELMVLHVYALTRALDGRSEAAATLARQVLEAMIDDMDRTLREIGVGDMSVGRKVKQMAAAFYGRSAAYDAARDDEGRALEDAIVRNVYAGVAPAGDGPRRLAAYLTAMIARIAESDDLAIAEGRISYPEM